MTPREQVELFFKATKTRPSKKLGQHFLIDADVLTNILEAAEIKPDETIVEIGPGFGLLTAELVKRAGRVIAVEKDPKMVELLARYVNAPNLEIWEADALRADFTGLAPYAVVANLPYYITSPIIRNFLEYPVKPDRLVVMVQREVAWRMTADPPNSTLAFSMRYYSEPELIAEVPPEAFYPAPAVSSAILKILIRPQPAFPADTDKLFRLVKAGFGEKRKQLVNSLAGGLKISSAEASNALLNAGISATRRAQSLKLEEWKALYNAALHLLK